MRIINIVLCVLPLLISSIGLSQESVFWEKLQFYNEANRSVSKYMEINAYTNSNTKEIHESGYGHIYREGDNLMIKVPEGISIGNTQWAIQIIEPQNTIVVTRAITQTPNSTSHLDFVKVLLEMKRLGTLKFKETDKEYILSTSDVPKGQYREVVWCFKKQGDFDINRTIVFFNKMNLTDNTSSGGSGEDYTLQDPRLEIVYLDKKISPILIADIITYTNNKVELTKAYSGYTLIDMTERYEAPNSQN